MYEMIYGVSISHDENTDEVILTVPDFDDLISRHPEREVPTARYYDLAEDAILAALEARMATKDPIPVPTRLAAISFEVVLDPLTVLKLSLYEEMLSGGVTGRELARRLKKDDIIVRRMLDLRHSSKSEQLVQALGALGKRVVISARIVDLDKAA